LGGRQQKAVLALLIAEAGGAVSVGRLADALWGQRLPSGYVTTLQTYVFHLREVLEPQRGRGDPGRVIVTVPGGYRLDVEDEAIDARTFEQLVRTGQASLSRRAYADASADLDRALAMWRGDLLADLAEFPFVQPIAARFEECRVSAAEARIDVELALGRHASAVAEVDRLIEQNPLRERLHEQRMLALYRCRRQSDALAAYRELRTVLSDGLGIDPGPSLQQLHQAILAQDTELDWRPNPSPAMNSPPGGQPARRPRHRRQRLEISLLGDCRVAVGETDLVALRPPPRACPADLSAAPSRRTATSGAPVGTVLAGVHGCAGEDQPASRAAPP
jgi:DNA-binding SARP family transcriptional activator